MALGPLTGYDHDHGTGKYTNSFGPLHRHLEWAHGVKGCPEKRNDAEHAHWVQVHDGLHAQMGTSGGDMGKKRKKGGVQTQIKQVKQKRVAVRKPLEKALEGVTAFARRKSVEEIRAERGVRKVRVWACVDVEVPGDLVEEYNLANPTKAVKDEKGALEDVLELTLYDVGLPATARVRVLKRYALQAEELEKEMASG